MNTPLISPDDVWLLWAVILGGVALSIYLEQNFRWAAKLSGPVLALVLAMTLSNLKVVPPEAPAYDLIWDYLVPVAIPLLLFRANLFHIARTTGTMFVAFHISTLGSMIGAIVATVWLRPHLESAEKLAAIMAGSYIGGSVNFFALKNIYQVPENLTGPLLVADNFIMAGVFIVLLMLAGSKFMRRHYPHPHSKDEDVAQAQALAAQHWKRKEISLLDVAKGLALAFAIVAAAHTLAGWIKGALTSENAAPSFVVTLLGNMYLLITVITVAVSTLFPQAVQRINGAEELGGYLLYVFLFAIGLPADLWLVITKVPVMFLFCLVIAVANLILTLVAGKLFKFSLEELLLCVNASIGGPPSAAAMAIARGWPKLVLPAVLVGIWGYVIGTFIGVVIGETLLRWL